MDMLKRDLARLLNQVAAYDLQQTRNDADESYLDLTSNKWRYGSELIEINRE